MTYLEEYIASVAALPSELQKNYQLLRELDQRFQALQKHMQQQCAKGLDEVLKAVETGSAAPDVVALQHSQEVSNVHKACLTLADEKVLLAVQTYDLVDCHIQRLDRDLKKFEEELRRAVDSASCSELAPCSLYRDFRIERRLEVVYFHQSLGWRELGEWREEMEVMEPSRVAKRWLSLLHTATPHEQSDDCQVLLLPELCMKSVTRGGQTIPNNVNMELDLPVDPNEPTYCYCGQVSYGEMIACDNPECKIEWFHFDCVGIKERPKGKWYCSDCSALMKRRRVKVSTGGKLGHQSVKKSYTDVQIS